MSPSMAMAGQDVEKSANQRGVKDMYENGIEHVPVKYILPAAERPSVVTQINPSHDHLNFKLPIIDFAQLQGPNRSQALEFLAYACENYGFFQLVNHGIPDEIINSMVNVSKRFFEMPLSEREKYMSADTNSPVRYGTSFNQSNDDVFCWRDFLKLICNPMPDVLPHCPSSPSDFRELAVSYAKETKVLFLMVVEAILETLGLINTEKKAAEDEITDENEASKVLKELENGSQMMVVNCYPPCPQPDLTLGMPPHSDYGFLTLLLQDEVEGLQILHQHNWLTVQPVPGSFVVNLGDHLEIFSNGKYKSVLHRVVVNTMKYRISVASLHSVPSTSRVRAADKLISEANPRRYKDTDFTTFLNYIKSCDSKNKNFLESRKLN